MKWIPSRKKANENDFLEGEHAFDLPDDLDETLTAADPPTKQQILESTSYYTCTKNCYGVSGQAGQCCKVGDRDFIMGPIHDTERFLSDLAHKLGKPVKFEDVFITFEEGCKLFPDKQCWQERKNFPAMRIVPDQAKDFPCQMLSNDYRCTVYSIRPGICRTYRCDYLKQTIEVLEKTL